MKKEFIFIFLSLVTVNTVFAYPHVLDWKNKPQIVFDNNKEAVNLKKNQELKSPFFAVTSRLDELHLDLNPFNEIYLFKNTKIQIYEVFEDVHQEHNLFLIDGSIHLKYIKPDTENKTVLNRIQTPFFDLDQPLNADVIITLNMKEPSVEIKMIKGSWNIYFFAYEKKLQLKAGQQVKFTGVLSEEPDQIKYDYLLDEKKIPQGRLGDVQKFDFHQFEQQKKVGDSEIIKKEQIEKRKKDLVLKKKKKYEAAFLCKSPYGELNQCAWKIINQKCIRQRCNASGEWGDQAERPLTNQCTVDFLVGTCDY